MYLEQILRKHEMEVFEQGLAAHQQALTVDGLTIPARAVIEHNVVAASRIYENVRLEELGTLLDIAPGQAERVAARMISEGRLQGSIDQVEGILQYEGGADELQQWDERIGHLCLRLNRICASISMAHPELTKG
jgi:COP9 signalosome complex subunit 4